jgi:hypothetical protein
MQAYRKLTDDRRVAEAYSRAELPLSSLPSFRGGIEGIAGHLVAEVLA